MLGTTIAHYKITAKLGQGGMGEVYRARDTKLDREVAIKVLPQSVALDKERLARFEREAKVLAQLNHPNIAAVYGLEQAGDTQALILELVEGDDLSVRLKRGPLPVDEALEVCKQIAEALEAAHEKGIIHRDLKPGNIKLTEDGKVKVLDFGLAKALSDESDTSSVSNAEDSPTITDAFTKPGTILGTAAYMSPEQARGKHVDKRTDIWAFGCVLFECLKGQKAFGGEDVTETLAAIIKGEPNWRALPPNTPPSIQLLLRKCLAKDRKRRLHDIADAGVDLELAMTDADHSIVKSDGEKSSGWTSTTWLPWTTTALALLSFVVTLFILYQKEGVLEKLKKTTVRSGPLRKLEIPISQSAGMIQGRIRELSISPDGRKLAFVTFEGLWLKALDHFGPSKLLVASSKVNKPFWSPDSAHIAWFDHINNTLMRASVADSRAMTICQITSRFPGSFIAGGAWLENQQIVFATGYGGLFRVASMGGDAEEFLLPSEDEDDYHEASVMPDGKGVFFIIHRKSADDQDLIDTIAAWRPDENGDGKIVLYQEEGARIKSPVVSNSGYMLFEKSRNSTVNEPWALRFDIDELEVIGEAFPLTIEGSRLSVSKDGTLAMVRRLSYATDQLVWINRTGGLESSLDARKKLYGRLHLSPDGNMVAYTEKVSTTSGYADRIWIANLELGTLLPFSEEGTSEASPCWLPNGRELVFGKRNAIDQDQSELLVRDIDGSGPGRTLLKGFQLTHVSQSGRYMLLSRLVNADNSGIQSFYARISDGPIEPIPFPGRFLEEFSFDWRLSPDDSLLAYSSAESGEREVYTVAFPGFTNRVVVSREGGWFPTWRPDGKELFFISKNRRSLMSAPCLNQENRQFGEPVKLFDFPSSAINFSFAPSTDGERFLVIQPVRSESEEDWHDSELNVLLIQNWTEEYGQTP